jgi:hypothetical protein
MKFFAKFANGIFVCFALIGAPLPSYAAPSGIPTAKQTEKIKVVDSKNKRLGFIGASPYLTFKADGRFFWVLANKERLIAQPYSSLLFELSGCSGLAYLANLSEGAPTIYEDAFLKLESDGYTVYMYDLTLPFDPNVSVRINSELDPDGTCNESGGYNTYVRRAKAVGKLPFSPPFTLK